jgi:hypothetical protein
LAGLCAEFPRYGYRLITAAQLHSEDVQVNHNTVFRVMREQGL